tara:strand:- start:1155 stop:2135 length:981 start_codon:yes stop_codon:yes gene_type:complete
MAGFTLNFNANTIDDYYICYREDGTVDPFTCVTETITSLGPNSVNIQIPDNIYCAPAILEGYIIAACQDQTDTNLDLIPDAAITFNITIDEVVDPCQLYDIQCVRAGVFQVVLDTIGTGCTDGSYPLAFTDGTAITPVTGTVTITGSGATIGVSIADPGLYTIAPTIVDTSGFGCGVAPTFIITMGDCIPLELDIIECNGNSGVTSPAQQVVIPFLDSIHYCIDEALLPALPDDFDTSNDPPEDCHCIDCEGLYVTNASGKTLVVTYQTCWQDNDEGDYGPIVTVAHFVVDGESELFIDCVIPDTVEIEEGGSFDWGDCDGSGVYP